MKPGLLGSTVGRCLSALAIGMVFPMLLSPSALAHSNEVGADPAADSVLVAMPEAVSLTFDEGLLEAGAALVVTAEDGTVVSAAPPVIADRTITATIIEGGPGTYVVAYRVVSGDGHPVTGTYAFTVSGEPSQSPAPTSLSTPVPTPEGTTLGASAQADPSLAATSGPLAATEAEGSGVPNAMLIGIGALSLVLLAVAVVLVVRRQGQSKDGDIPS